MVATSMDARWAVVAKLQNDLARVNPGSDREQIIERAIDLALSESRTQQNPDHLYRDVLRNAKYTFYRSKQRGQTAWARYNGQFDISFAEEGVDVTEHGATVEEEAEGGNLLRYLRMAANQLGSVGVAFLEHLANGKRPAEAALAVGISRATAYRNIAALRKHVDAWTGEAA